MYKIKARWAGYILNETTGNSLQEVECRLKNLAESFESGMARIEYGVKMDINVLCVDVVDEAGKLVLERDFKK